MAFDNLFRKTYWTLAACGLVYAVLIGALTHPTVQRHATYAHKVNPTVYQDLNDTEQFGFVHGQVQPFTVTTPDNANVFAWHILPLHLYHTHECSLTEQSPPAGVAPLATAAHTVGLQLLLNDPSATVVVSFHGNAGHVASSHRPATYRQFLAVSTPARPVHVIAFDYRGFGLSTGTPTEDGVIQDAVAVVAALADRGVDPSRIILAGQSLGTFVATALYHEWVLGLGRAPFKALVLFASFRSLPRLLDSYSIKGITPPLLSPLMAYPKVQQWFLQKIVDRWDTNGRLVALAAAPGVALNLVMMHARDDWEIPWREGRSSWDAVVAAAARDRAPTKSNLDHESWTSADGVKRLRWERVRHGGHNRIPTGEQAKLAIMRLMEDAPST